jgi:uncharacterized phage infection (PIP) family protein YhgE
MIATDLQNLKFWLSKLLSLSFEATLALLQNFKVAPTKMLTNPINLQAYINSLDTFIDADILTPRILPMTKDAKQNYNLIVDGTNKMNNGLSNIHYFHDTFAEKIKQLTDYKYLVNTLKESLNDFRKEIKENYDSYPIIKIEQLSLKAQQVNDKIDFLQTKIKEIEDTLPESIPHLQTDSYQYSDKRLAKELSAMARKILMTPEDEPNLQAMKIQFNDRLNLLTDQMIKDWFKPYTI